MCQVCEDLTITKAVEKAGITKHVFKTWESEWQALHNEEIPIPRNDRGWRVFSPDWVKWLIAVRETFESRSEQPREQVWQYIWYEVPTPNRYQKARQPVAVGPEY